MRFLIIIAALFFTSLTACKKDLLNPIPQTSISDAVAFQTPERTLQTVHGMYAGVKVGQFITKSGVKISIIELAMA
jgi:hypothetical protein